MIRELVGGLFIPERSADCYDSLKNVGNRAVPFLVAAVNESRLPTGTYSLVPQELPNLNSTLYRIGELLAASGSEAALVHFTEYLRSEDQRFCEYSAWGLGSIALEPCAEPVKRILASEDRKIRTFAVMGIGRALAAGRGEMAFFEGIRGSLDEFLYFENAEVYQTLIEVESQYGTGALSAEERNFFSASLYYFEIQNGGPWQYFGNSTANYQRMIVAGLRALGAPGTAQILEDAGTVFGPEGPPEDRDARNAMIDTFTAEQVKIVDGLYSTFPSGENIEMLLFLYVAEHKAEFRTHGSPPG